jgi:hypothetical protein
MRPVEYAGSLGLDELELVGLARDEVSRTGAAAMPAPATAGRALGGAVDASSTPRGERERRVGGK